MLKKLTDTTALYPLGLPHGHRLLRLPSGPYAGRLVALFLSSSNELRMMFADPPGIGWSAPQTIATDIADSSFDCCIAADCSIHLAYIAAADSSLKSRKLSYAAGTWTVGAAVTVYNSEPTLNPSIAIDRTNRLWLAFNRLDSGNWFVHLKSSTDSGTSWGIGAADPGDALSTGAQVMTSKLIAAPETLHAIIAYGSNKIVARLMPFDSGIWSADYTIASGLTGFNDQFDAALGPDGRMAVAYNDSQFRVREFDGSVWSAAVTLDSTVQGSPQVVYRNAAPTVLWLKAFNYEQRRLMYSSRHSGLYSDPKPLDPRADLFDSVLLYDHASASYTDITSAAADMTSSDLFHPASGCLLRQAGDALLVGMNERFRYLHLLLTPAGAGGTLNYSYWNGASWVPFTPASGASHLDTTTVRVNLWTDYRSIPLDWQKKAISGKQHYWVRLEVSSDFSAGPIGSQITAISELQTLILRR
jgi:hypothetical protein